MMAAGKVGKQHLGKERDLNKVSGRRRTTNAKTYVRVSVGGPVIVETALLTNLRLYLCRDLEP